MVRKISVKRISGTTDTSGDATVYSSPFGGKLLSFHLDIDALDATADVTVTSDSELVAQTLYSSTNSNTNVAVYPREYAMDTAGADLTFDGTRKVPTEFVLNGRVKVVVAQGGSTKAFTINAYVEEY